VIEKCSWPPSNSTAAADVNRCFIIVGATISRAVAAAERQAVSRQMRHTLVLVAIILATVACNPAKYDVPARDLPAPLAPPTGAKVKLSRVVAQAAGVEYEYEEPYPAKRLLTHMASQISPNWQPRKEDFLNPGIPTSHVRGWVDYVDATTRPETRVHMWSSEWENESGDILSYSLLYRSPNSEESRLGPTTQHVSVHASITPRDQMDAMRRSLRKGG